MYSRLPPSVAADYNWLKEALLKLYILCKDGYRPKFRKVRPEKGESSEQQIDRLNKYVESWVGLSKAKKSSLCDVCYRTVH